MDSAVYEPATQKIFGVRGQWIFKFNSVTGALEDTLRFTTSTLSQTYIIVFGANLYISCYNSPVLNTNGSAPFTNGGDVYVINPASFTVAGVLGLTAGIQPGHASTYGWASMATDGANLCITDKNLSRWNSNNVTYILDPTNIPAYVQPWGGWVTDITYDSTNSVFWGVEADSSQIFAADSVSTCNNTTSINPVFGICWNALNNKVYAVAGDQQFYMVNPVGHFPGFTNFVVTTVNTGRINANPFRIKSVNNQAGNPRNGKVLIPCWADDTVLVWNATTDSVESVQTGFTAPIDVVVCPTKNWAVQTGTTGLREIT